LGAFSQSATRTFPSYKALDTLAFDLGTAVNNQNALGSDANGAAGGPVFNLPGTESGAASTISLAITDRARFAAAAAGNGSSDDTNLETMLQLQTQAIAGGTTPSNYYSSFVSALGTSLPGLSREYGTAGVPDAVADAARLTLCREPE